MHYHVHSVKSISQLRFNYDTTTIRRCHKAFDFDDGSDRNYDLRSIRLRYDYDTTTTKNWHANFLLASNRVEWKQAHAIRRSPIVVVSQWRSRIVISITSVVVECVVVSSYILSSYTTYRSLVVVESQLWYRLRYDYDPTTTYRARLFPFDAIQREQKLTCQFFVVVLS